MLGTIRANHVVCMCACILDLINRYIALYFAYFPIYKNKKNISYTISKKVIRANSYLVRQYMVIWAYHSKTPNGILYTICCKNLLLLSSLQRKRIRQGKEKTKKVGDYFFFVFSCSSSVCANFHLDRVYKYSTAC